MGREHESVEYKCLECYYGCKGHKMVFNGQTTSMTARFEKDGHLVTSWLLYDDMKAMYECLKKVFVNK